MPGERGDNDSDLRTKRSFLKHCSQYAAGSYGILGFQSLVHSLAPSNLILFEFTQQRKPIFVIWWLIVSECASIFNMIKYLTK